MFLLQTNEMMERKRREIKELEKRSLPTRHYLHKYILPNITSCLVEVAKQRPSNPVEFLAKLLLNQNVEPFCDETDIDKDVADDFEKLIESTKCEKEKENL